MSMVGWKALEMTKMMPARVLLTGTPMTICANVRKDLQKLCAAGISET